MRIVSLLPSATEIVGALGLGGQLVGVSHECDFPTSVARLPKVTRSLIPEQASSREVDQLVRQRLNERKALYELDRPALEALQPDLIVTQALCDVCAVAESEVREAACSLPGAPRVLNLEPRTLAEVLDSMRHVAQAAGVDAQRAEPLIGALQARVQADAARSAGLRQRPRVALLEWLDPPFSCGHWSPELVRLAGGVEGLGREGHPSRRLDWDEVLAWQPEVVFIACCGYDAKRALADLPPLRSIPAWRDLPAVRAGRVYVSDGSQYFSRPGPRLVDSLEILAHALHPESHPLPEGLPQPVRVEDAASGGTMAQRQSSGAAGFA
jgi:iron complex transport system substrate-binding protein